MRRVLTHQEPYDYFSATMSGDFLMPNGAWCTIPFDTVSYDKHGHFASYGWTPTAGIILVCFVPLASLDGLNYGIAVNGDFNNPPSMNSIYKGTSNHIAPPVRLIDLTDGTKTYTAMAYGTGAGTYTYASESRFWGFSFKS